MAKKQQSKEKEVKMNMLRERADKLPDVSEEMFQSCNKHNVMLVKQYLETSNTLSPDTLKQYKSGLYQFTYWLKENAMDKPFYKVKKFDFKRYMSYLVSRGMSSSSLKFKKSSISAFCTKFIEVFIVEDYEEYATFRNFTTGTIEIPKNNTYEKIPISKEEYELMMKTLEDDENWLGMAWVAVMWNVGCRRSESLQFKTEILNYDAKGKNYVLSHVVRGKGQGLDGKADRFMIPLSIFPYIEKWIATRGYESDYIFTTLRDGKPVPLGRDWCNRFCTNVLSDIVGRRINVHLFKASAITYMLESGKDIKTVSKYVAQHEDVSTTQAFYDLRDDSAAMDDIYN